MTLSETELIKNYRGRGLIALYEVLADDVPDLEKQILAVKHSPESFALDNALRGQLVSLRKTLNYFEILLGQPQ